VIDLQQNAVNFVETTPPQNLTSSQSFEHVDHMRQRALKAVLPSLFEVVKSYEDYVIQQGLFEGSDKVDLGKGKHHTWQAIPRLTRQSLHRKRMRSNGSAEESSSGDSRLDKPRAANHANHANHAFENALRVNFNVDSENSKTSQAHTRYSAH
jgi:hypothetical protein